MANRDERTYLIKDILRVGTVLTLLGGAVFFGRSIQRIESGIAYLIQDQRNYAKRLENLETRFRDHDRESERWKERVEENSRKLSGKH